MLTRFRVEAKSLAFLYRVPDLNPGFGVISRLSLLLVSILVSKVFFGCVYSSIKTNISNFQFDRESERNVCQS